MGDYENMSKEELIAEIKWLRNNMKEIDSFDKRVIDQNNRFHDLVKSIQFLLDNSYDNIRNN